MPVTACRAGYVTATPLPSFVDGEKTTSWLRLRSPSEDALDTVQSWKAIFGIRWLLETIILLEETTENPGFPVIS
jgi:hypothetical protein